MFVDVLQTALPADPFEFPPELLHFERFQPFDFLAFLKEFFFFTSLSACSGFLPCRLLATDGGGDVAWVTSKFGCIAVRRVNIEISITLLEFRETTYGSSKRKLYELSKTSATSSNSSSSSIPLFEPPSAEDSECLPGEPTAALPSPTWSLALDSFFRFRALITSVYVGSLFALRSIHPRLRM